jgi:transposase
VAKKSRPNPKIRQLEEEITKLSRKLMEVEAELAFFRKQLYGPKRDRPSPEAQLLIQELFDAELALKEAKLVTEEEDPDPDGGGSAGRGDAADPGDAAASEGASDAGEGSAAHPTKPTEGKKSGKKGPANAKRLRLIHTGLEERVITLAPDPQFSTEPETGKPRPISHYIETRRLAEEPAKLYVLITRRPVYQQINDLGETTLVTTPAPTNNPIDRCKADVSLLAGILVQKYQYHLPTYRIQEIYQAGTIGFLPRSTLCGWITGCARSLQPIVNRMKELMMQQKLIGLDDTTVCLLAPGRGKVDAAKLWAYTCILKEAPYVVYDFTMTREGCHPLAFIPETFLGTLLGDAYSGHYRVMLRPGVNGAGCWDHARRYLTNASVNDPKRMARALFLVRNLYAVEAKADALGLNAQEIVELRARESVPILAQIRTWVEEIKSEAFLLENTRKATVYLTNQWERLNHYLSDGDIPISNIRTEQAMRGVAVGRKNWLFCGSELGGENLAIILSLITTCKTLQIDPRTYLQDVLSRVNTHPQAQLDELLPDRWKAIQEAAGRQVESPTRKEWRKPSVFVA